MRRVLFALLLMLPMTADARPKQKLLLQQPSGLIVTPFAIPVGIPVGIVQSHPVWYGYSGPQQPVPQPQPHQCPTPEDEANVPVATANHVSAPTLSAKCAKCHSGPAPKGGFRMFDEIEFGAFEMAKLTDELRLECIRRITSDDETERMPKGPVASPEEVGKMIQELTQKGR